MKKLIALVMTLVMAVGMFAGCLSATALGDGMPNPFIDCDTMKEAEKIAGFSMTTPKKIRKIKISWIQAVEDDMIQVAYESKKDEIRVRKAYRTQNLDGDYNNYKYTRYTIINKKIVKLRGDSDRFYVVNWNSGKFSYSITTAKGFTKKQVKSLVSRIS